MKCPRRGADHKGACGVAPRWLRHPCARLHDEQAARTREMPGEWARTQDVPTALDRIRPESCSRRSAVPGRAMQSAPPEAGAQVRILPGAPSAESTEAASHLLKQDEGPIFFPARAPPTAGGRERPSAPGTRTGSPGIARVPERRHHSLSGDCVLAHRCQAGTPIWRTTVRAAGVPRCRRGTPAGGAVRVRKLRPGCRCTGPGRPPGWSRGRRPDSPACRHRSCTASRGRSG